MIKAQKTDQKAELEEMFEKQRVEERKEREQEKESLVRDIRAGIKDEIKTEMKPLEEKTAKIEAATASMGDKFEELANKVNVLEEKLAELKENHTVNTYSDVVRNQTQSQNQEGQSKSRSPTKFREKQSEDKDKVKDLFRSAGKVIGLKPIDKIHVEHIKRRQSESMKDKSEDEQWEAAMKSAVEMFLDKEMRIRGEDYKSLNIVKIFPPAKENWNVLYVELETQTQADFVYTFTQYMRKNVKGDGKPEVQVYVPKQLYNRFRAINHMAYKIREASGRMQGTRVTLGKEDFILQQRCKTDRGKGWGDPLALPEDLPEFELSLQRGPLSPGEAPGRAPLTPQHEEGRKRKGRSSSGSTGISQSPPTKRKEISLQEEITAADLVSSCTVKSPPAGLGLLQPPEVGFVTNIQGTPGRLQSKFDSDNFSPVIGSRRQTKQQ